MFALCKTASPSAYAAIRPYSMPLCTISTKWPAPLGPQCRYPLLDVVAAVHAPVSLGCRRCPVPASWSWPPDRRIGATDHHAVSAFLGPRRRHSCPRPCNGFASPWLRRGAADVVDIVRIAAVDQDVAGREQRRQIGDRLIDDSRGNHWARSPVVSSWVTKSASVAPPIAFFDQFSRPLWAIGSNTTHW